MTEKQSKALFGTSLCLMFGVPILIFCCEILSRASGFFYYGAYYGTPTLVASLVGSLVLIAVWFCIALKCSGFVNGAARAMAYILGAVSVLTCVTYMIGWFVDNSLLMSSGGLITKIIINIISTILCIIFFAGCRVWSSIKAIGIIGVIFQGIGAIVWPMSELLGWYNYGTITIIVGALSCCHAFMFFNALILAIIWTCVPGKNTTTVASN